MGTGDGDEWRRRQRRGHPTTTTVDEVVEGGGGVRGGTAVRWRATPVDRTKGTVVFLSTKIEYIKILSTRAFLVDFEKHVA